MKGRRNDVGWCAAVAAALMCFTLLLAGGTAVAGEHDGMIRGRVADAKNTVLAGAAVVVRPGDLAFVTDVQGFFVATGLEPGTYTVEIIAIGFTTATQEVQVKANTRTMLEVKLQPAARIAETVNVTATRIHGELEALNQRASALDIVNVLPLELITSLPNANVADAIGRLPSVSLERDQGEGKFVQVRGLEPRFTSVQINDAHIPSSVFEVRQVKLDALPSDLVGQVELHKTGSADMDGDAIGGSVNLVTKTAGDTPYFTVSTEGGYNPFQGGHNKPYEVSGMWSQRFGKDKALGAVIGGSYDWNGRGINDVEPAASTVDLPDGSSTNAFTEIAYRDYQFDRTRIGVAGGLDYRLGINSSLYLRGFFSDFKNHEHRWDRKVEAGDFLTPTLTDTNGAISGRASVAPREEQNYSVSAGGTHDLGAAVLDYNLAYSHARNHDHTDRFNFDGPSAAFAVDSSNGLFPKLTPLGVNQLDPTQYVISGCEFDDEISLARDAALRVNVAFPYTSGELKIGGKYRDENKTTVYHDTYFDATGDPSLLVSQALDSFTDPHYYYDHYPQGPNLSVAAATKFFHDNPGGFKEDLNAEHLFNDANNFGATEKVAALYAMNTNTVGKLEITVGVRVERTNANYSGFEVVQDAEGNWASTHPVSGHSTYTNVLPSLSVRWELDPKTNLRGVYSWGVARPDFGHLVPTFELYSNRNEIDVGNPDLKPTKATSYDLLFEHFLGSVGLVSAGVFYKDLTDPIYPGSVTIIHGGIYDGYFKVQPINGPKANIYGFEVAYQQHLSSLPGVLSSLGIDANYTHTVSKATFDPTLGRTGTAELQRTTPNIFNFGLTYDRGPWAFRAAVQYNSATIFLYQYIDGAPGGLHGPLGDTYLYPHTQIDAQVSYAFKNGLEIKLSGLNLNNEVFGFYNGDPHWNIQREFYDRTFSLGFKFTR
jgi:TonB-dependent receptor